MSIFLRLTFPTTAIINISCNINITLANVRQESNLRAHFDFFIEINDLDHLNRMFSEVAKVPGVIQVNRAKDYGMGKKRKRRL